MDEHKPDPDAPNPYDVMHAIFVSHIERAVDQISRSDHCPAVAYDEDTPEYMATMLTSASIMMINAVDLHEEAMLDEEDEE